MSDTTLSAGRDARGELDADTQTRTDSSSGEGEFDKSYDQSPSSASKEGALGYVESKTDGSKQKRKRTSPTDQATLEAEYKQNPKPNKAARAEIVEKVSLNEKEVQIWFQNRRQINRRKSRPLLPHEIAAFGLGGMAALSSDPAQPGIFSSSQGTEESGQSSQGEMVSSQEEEPSKPQADILAPRDEEERVEPVSVQDAKTSTDLSLPPLPSSLDRQCSGTSLNEGGPFSASESVIKSFTSTPGYLSNRWKPANSLFSTPSSTQDLVFGTPTISQPKQPASCPERLMEVNTPSSSVRLSMSLEGKAELVSTSPSPPHAHATRPSLDQFMPPQKRMRTLQRSQSALPLSTQGMNSSTVAPFAPRLATGRSRDARSWQFCCDGDARDELTTHAEHESNGSAIAAISLMRSTSNTALKSNANKRNTQSIKQDSSKQGKKAKLGRAHSSLARLQFPGKGYEQSSGHGKDGLMRSPSGDSDKENWLPGENAASNRRQPLPSSRNDRQSNSRTVLGDNHNIPSHAVNLGGRSRKRKSEDIGSHIFEDDQENSEQPGEEVEKFMRGEVSPSKKGDLDCIQGLLSLSKGNWR